MQCSSSTAGAAAYTTPTWRRQMLCTVLALVGLYRFSASFFLAKRCMPHTSLCESDSAAVLLRDTLGLTRGEVDRLFRDGILARHDDAANIVTSEGCWTKRRVDAMAIIVVDALRFDFAVDHLPKSVGARLERHDRSKTEPPRGQSQLFKFVADPPTVTMQRLKALTTGGLPTFADISGSFGGANVDEDSWVQQLRDVPPSRRGLAFSTTSTHGDTERPAKIAFVGDDTWIDLFPHIFDDSHPFPSFNTRDLHTVDNGCLKHLPRLLDSLGSGNDAHIAGNQYFEVIVTHFLGVDHVGHTYGPHDPHMADKLEQMDDALSSVLTTIDKATRKCQVAFVFGDHGMTEDGNHGGGTDHETNAALFAHYSPGCGNLGPSIDVTGSEAGANSRKAFRSIHQIDLVPTIAMLLGLPIPYANLGGLVPSLLPPISTHQTMRNNTNFVEAPIIAAALALNAAQVWNYLTTYSATANSLPAEPLTHLASILHQSVSVYKAALSHDDAYDALAYRETCGLFKYFLSEATDLGRRVWTQFDETGMNVGIITLCAALLLGFPSWQSVGYLWKGRIVGVSDTSPRMPFFTYAWIEIAVTGIFVFFQCAVLTFSNSYIESEEEIIMFSLTVLCTMTSCRQFLLMGRTFQREIASGTNKTFWLWPNLKIALVPMVIPACSRGNSLFVTGHGLDPVIRQHGAHHEAVFFTSLTILGILRSALYSGDFRPYRTYTVSLVMDLCSLVCLSVSWWEKRVPDSRRNGYSTSLASLLVSSLGIGMLLCTVAPPGAKIWRTVPNRVWTNYSFQILFKILVIVITVTGPSAASSAWIFLIQAWAFCQLLGSPYQIQPSVSAALWRLVTRHAFFSTGHACSFNRLHYSAAFVATETFYYVPAAISLFFNTFGWDFLGCMFLLIVSNGGSHHHRWHCIWTWFCFYQLLETVSSCISASHLKRHLMVWSIFAPRFVFAAIFMVICVFCWMSELIVMKPMEHAEKKTNKE